MPFDDKVTSVENEIHKALKDIDKTLSDAKKTVDNISKQLKDTNDKILKDAKKSSDDINKDKQKTSDKVTDTEEESADKIAKKKVDTAQEIAEIEEKASEKTSKAIVAAISSAVSKLDNAIGNVTNKYKSLLTEYANEQQKLAFNIFDSGISYDVIRDSLSALSTSSYVKQNDVYKNLTQLVSSGITMNAAQRAFLQTTSNQVDLGFNTLDSNLNRLIQLQEMDLSEARMAQMSGLKTFLEQNYQNSQYIKEGFSNVSASLLEMQSLMSAQMAMSTEKTIQTYLGAFSSAGGASNSVSSIAQALGAIGSGDFSGLNEGMQNLMVMAASRAGLSYADLLLNGLDDSKSEQLMTRLLTYVSSMSDMGGGSNVAMNAVAKMFGVTVSDIRAAQQMNVQTIKTSDVSTDISDFLFKLASTTNQSTALSNIYDNLVSNRALYGDLLSWNLKEGLFNTLGSFGSLAASIGGAVVGGKKGELLAAARPLIDSGISAIPGLTLTGEIFSDAGGFGMLKNLFSQVGDVDWLGNIMEEGLVKGISSSLQDTTDAMVRQILTNISGGVNGLLSDYYYFDMGNSLYTSNGTFFADDVAKVANKGISQSGHMGRSPKTGETTSGKVTTGKTEEQTTVKISGTNETTNKTTDDILNTINDPTSVPYSTISEIVESNNVVLLGSQEITADIVDATKVTAKNTEDILVLLTEWYTSMPRLLGANIRERSMLSSYETPQYSNDWSGMGARG